MPALSASATPVPLTVNEYDEWGDPADPGQFAWMRAYTPYENVTARDYPPILAITSLNDTRVLYVEPAKWIAKLRAHDQPCAGPLCRGPAILR